MQLPKPTSTPWLEEARQLTSAVYKIADCLLLLASKRTTLEEKMLARHLNMVASNLGEILTFLHKSLADQGLPTGDDVLSDLGKLDCELIADLDELLKIGRFNLNFLEQYFEHDFYSRLVERRKYLERLEAIKAKL